MTAGILLAALALPPEARVDQRVPKKLLQEHGAATAADRRLIQEAVEEAVWVAALKPATVGTLAYRDEVREYLEIAVLTVALRGAPTPARTGRLVELVHRAIPYPVVLATAVARPKYRRLFTDGVPAPDAAAVHDGYFSIDRKGVWTDTAESNQAGRDSAERAYNLIMKDKERLLGFETPLQFIFSHSALREGWDHPNVFQICTLREIGTERERRQTIGRGLRLCVNQQGERVRGHDVNTLTVIATESYESFAENLQKEIEADTGIRFGIVEKHQFAGLAAPAAGGGVELLGAGRSEALGGALESPRSRGLHRLPREDPGRAPGAAQGRDADASRRVQEPRAAGCRDADAPGRQRRGRSPRSTWSREAWTI